jgi:hypothetical protein
VTIEEFFKDYFIPLLQTGMALGAVWLDRSLRSKETKKQNQIEVTKIVSFQHHIVSSHEKLLMLCERNEFDATFIADLKKLLDDIDTTIDAYELTLPLIHRHLDFNLIKKFGLNIKVMKAFLGELSPLKSNVFQDTNNDYRLLQAAQKALLRYQDAQRFL